MSSKLCVIAGEVSGDLYASHLVAALRERRSDLCITAIGGERLKECSDAFLFESAHQHGVGIQSKWSKRRFKQLLLRCLEQSINEGGYEKAIIVDFQHYNEAIASLFREKGVPVYTFITPNFWMWRSLKQAKRVVQYSEKIVTIFKKEYAFYKTLSDNVYYFGHPQMDILKDQQEFPALTASDEPRIALLPGSRPQEFALYLKKMCETVSLIQEKVANSRFVIVVSSKRFVKKIESVINQFPELDCELSFEPSVSVMKSSDLVLSASGSATLEVVLLNRPLIVFAALPHLSYFLAKYVLRLKLSYISLPNFLTDQMIVPEFVQYGMKPREIAEVAVSVLRDPEMAIEGYSKVREALAGEAVFSRCAGEILGD